MGRGGSGWGLGEGGRGGAGAGPRSPGESGSSARACSTAETSSADGRTSACVQGSWVGPGEDGGGLGSDDAGVGGLDWGGVSAIGESLMDMGVGTCGGVGCIGSGGTNSGGGEPAGSGGAPSVEGDSGGNGGANSAAELPGAGSVGGGGGGAVWPAPTGGAAAAPGGGRSRSRPGGGSSSSRGDTRCDAVNSGTGGDGAPVPRGCGVGGSGLMTMTSLWPPAAADSCTTATRPWEPGRVGWGSRVDPAAAKCDLKLPRQTRTEGMV